MITGVGIIEKVNPVYSGTTFSNRSGNLFGVHQKFNRTARAALAKIMDDAHFPSIRHINHFEGKNGPDGIKAKSPAQDEPWHYYDPYDPEDTLLLDMIEEHFQNLITQLRHSKQEKAAFEAAWLAHALVDGLTPAHHYPYEEELERIRGSSKETRNTIRNKMVIKGGTRRESIRRNWQFWGAKGLLTTHILFEWGVATILAPHKIKNGVPTEEEIADAKAQGIQEVFARAARRIAAEFAYDEFYRRGWTPSLAQWVRKDLSREITRTIVLAWFLALEDANL